MRNSPALIITVPADERGIDASGQRVLRVKQWKKNDEDNKNEYEHDRNARWFADDTIAVTPLVALLLTSQHLTVIPELKVIITNRTVNGIATRRLKDRLQRYQAGKLFNLMQHSVSAQCDVLLRLRLQLTSRHVSEAGVHFGARESKRLKRSIELSTSWQRNCENSFCPEKSAKCFMNVKSYCANILSRGLLCKLLNTDRNLFKLSIFP